MLRSQGGDAGLERGKGEFFRRANGPVVNTLFEQLRVSENEKRSDCFGNMTYAAVAVNIFALVPGDKMTKRRVEINRSGDGRGPVVMPTVFAGPFEHGDGGFGKRREGQG